MHPIATHNHGTNRIAAYRHAYALAMGGWVIQLRQEGRKWSVVVRGWGG